MMRGNFAPTRLINPPAHRERRDKMRMNGTKAAPAAVAEYPCTCCKLNGRKKLNAASAPYKRRVSRFAPVKVRERKRPSGIMGEEVRASTKTKAISAAM